MSTKQNTTPWKLSTQRIRNADDEKVRIIMRPTSTPDLNIRIGDILEDSDAARIVACVNNCEGINPAAVPALILAAERALPWLCKMLADGGNLETVNPSACDAAATMLRNALEAAKGRQA
jgi:hypothetical protein